MHNRRSTAQGEIMLPYYLPYLILRGLLVAMAATFALLVLCSAVMYFTPLSEVFVPYLVFGITLISIMLGSVYVGKRVDQKGWLRGGMTGIFYVLIVIFFNLFLVPGMEIGVNIIGRFLMGFSFGALGGILGINS